MYATANHGQDPQAMIDHADLPAPSVRRHRTARLSRRAADAPPHAYFVVSALFHYLGPAFAVLLFVRVDVLGVAWLRIASAAVLLGLWRRPWRSAGALDGAGRR